MGFSQQCHRKTNEQFLKEPFFLSVKKIFNNLKNLLRNEKVSWMVICGTIDANKEPLFYISVFAPSLGDLGHDLIICSLILISLKPGNELISHGHI